MRQDVTREFEGVVVGWESSQDKYWKGAGVLTGTKQAKKFGEDLSLSDYQEAAKVHADPRRREKFKTKTFTPSLRPYSNPKNARHHERRCEGSCSS